MFRIHIFIEIDNRDVVGDSGTELEEMICGLKAPLTNQNSNRHKSSFLASIFLSLLIDFYSETGGPPKFGLLIQNPCT